MYHTTHLLVFQLHFLQDRLELALVRLHVFMQRVQLPLQLRLSCSRRLLLVPQRCRVCRFRAVQ